MQIGINLALTQRNGGAGAPALNIDFAGTGSLPSTVTFSRGTNATLTGSNGLIQYAPHNLLTNSEDFEAAAWIKTAATVTANVTAAPDATTTGDKLVETAVTSEHYVRTPTVTLPTSGSTAIFSVYAKAGERNWLYLANASWGNFAYFDLTNGVVGSTGSATANMVPAGNGWFRCYIAFTANAGGQQFDYRLASANNTTSYAGDGTSGLFIWGAQLNVANAPVNLLTWSEQYSNAVYSITSGVTFSGSIATFAASGYRYQLFSSATNIVGTTYTAQVKLSSPSGKATIVLRISNNTIGADGSRRVINLTSTPTVYTITHTFANSGFGVDVGLDNRTALSGDGIVGNVVATEFQLNTGSVALPYVATTSSIYLPPAYNSTTPKNLLGFTQEPENAAWTKSNSYVQQNLLTWSQDFSNAAWTKDLNRGSFATNAISPIGDLTAQTLTAGTDNFGYAYRNAFPTTISTVYTYSFYAKAGTSNFAWFEMCGSVASYVNLTTLSIAPASGVTVTATSVGSGWVRITGVATASAATHNFSLGGANASGSAVMTSGNTAIFWGAQLVQGSTAGDYTQTTSAAAPTRYLNWDGTLTGRKLVEDTANNIHQAYVAYSFVVNGVYGWSLYAKAGERSWVWLNAQDGTDRRTWFNLANGTVGTNAAGNTANITSVGGGWYRCSINRTAAAASGFFAFGVTNADNTVITLGDGTSGIYVSDFQLSNSASVDPYVYNPQAAAASAAYYGPRFDYNPTTLAANGLLIEEQRTNLLTYSEQFDNAAWGGTGSTIAPNTAIAPSGTQSMDTLTETAVTDFHFTQQTFTATAATHTYSVYARLASGTRRLVLREGVSTGAYATFDLSSGTVAASGAGGTGTITAVGNNVYRCTVTFTAVAGTASMQVALTNGTTFVSYAGDGTSGVFIWGAQVELGSFATSYIPTVASQVTRNADSASMLGDNFYTWYNPNQGTFNTEYDIFSISAGMLGDGSVPSALLYSSNRDAKTFNGTSGPTTSNQTPLNVAAKAALSYDTNIRNVILNAGTVASATGNLQVVTALQLGLAFGSTRLNGHIRRIGYYNTRLPDSTLQALTT